MDLPVADSMPSVERDTSIYDGVDAAAVKLTQAVDLVSLVAYLTSDQVLDYSAMSDFYLTYRMFSTPEQVLELLLLRMTWAILRNDSADASEQGRDVGVRTFSAMRHWMLNYFADDFLPNIQLRQHMADGLNRLAQMPEVLKAPQFVKIIQQLKRAWLAELAVYWQMDGPNDLAAPVAVGGAFGSAAVSMDFDAATIEKRRLTLLSFYDGPISPMTAAEDVRQLGSLVKGGILIDSHVSVPFIKASPPRIVKTKRGLFGRRRHVKPVDYSDIHLTDKVDTLAWRVVEDLNAMLEVKARQMALMAQQMAAEESPIKQVLSASSSLSTLDNTVRLEPLRGSTSSGSIATVRQPKRDKTLDTLDLGTMLANTSSESEADDDSHDLQDTPNPSDVNLRRSATWMSSNPLEAMDIERVSYTGSMSSLSTLDNHSFISARSERVSKLVMHPLPPLPSEPVPLAERGEQAERVLELAPPMAPLVPLDSESSGFSFDNTPYSTSVSLGMGNVSLDDSDDDERFVDSCEDLGSPRRRRRPRPRSAVFSTGSNHSDGSAPSANCSAPSASGSGSLASRSGYSEADHGFNRFTGDQFTGDDSVASLEMLNSTILTPNRRPARHASAVSSTSSRSAQSAQSFLSPRSTQSRPASSPDTPLRDMGFVSPRRASTSDISLLSEQSNGKIRPCKGFNPEIAAELAAIPDDSVEGDAILTALRKLEGTYTSKRLIPSYVSGDTHLYEQAFASSSHLAQLQMHEVRVPSVRGLAIGEPPQAAAASTPIRRSLQHEVAAGPESGLEVYDRARHAPFVLGVSATDVCDQLTLIEKDALDQVDWKELVEVKWSQTPVTVESWLRLLATRNLRGVEVVVLRFNLVVDWVRSEIWLCQTPGMRAQAITRFIHIARLCRKAQNMASMMQIVLALSSQLIKGDLASWAIVSKDDLQLLERLERLASVSHNFSELRAEHSRFDGTRGCIPFLPIYLSDLRHNHDTKPGVVDGKINFSKFKKASSVVRSLMLCVEWSKNYRLKAQPSLLSKCLYLQALGTVQLESLK